MTSDDFVEVTRMHAVHFDPRRVLLAAVGALILALTAAASLPPAVDSLSSGGGGSAPTVERAPATPPPTWATDPLTSPLRTFETPAAAAS